MARDLIPLAGRGVSKILLTALVDAICRHAGTLERESATPQDRQFAQRELDRSIYDFVEHVRREIRKAA